MPAKVSLKLKEGDLAPDFESVDNGGKAITLREFKGKDVVLYFYPKDNTPGCTKEACTFRDSFDAFEKKGAIVLGVSTDPQKSHAKFVGKYHLPFRLVCD